jgi:hypothetical protein
MDLDTSASSPGCKSSLNCLCRQSTIPSHWNKPQCGRQVPPQRQLGQVTDEPPAGFPPYWESPRNHITIEGAARPTSARSTTMSQHSTNIKVAAISRSGAAKANSGKCFSSNTIREALAPRRRRDGPHREGNREAQQRPLRSVVACRYANYLLNLGIAYAVTFY